MFDIGASELLLIVIVAVVVIGPKDLPLAMRTAGRWIGKMRRISGHFRTGLDAMVREAEMEELERQWKEQNDAIMQKHPDSADMQAPFASNAEAAVNAEEAAWPAPGTDKADDSVGTKADTRVKQESDPQLPLPPP